MGFERDAEVIKWAVREGDPAFDLVPEPELSVAIKDMNTHATEHDRDAFLLASMRLVALAQNAHSRVIPNAAITVLPLRFVMRDGRLCLVRVDELLPVVSANGTGVDELLGAWRPLLSGNGVRQTVLSGLMLAWPAALAAAGVVGPKYDFVLSDGSQVVAFADDQVPACDRFAENETGAFVQGQDAYPEQMLMQDGSVWRVRLADLKAITDLEIGRMVDTIRSSPAGLVVDLRGNPGGSFLKALPLVTLIKDPSYDHRCAVLVNGYTFSAALVVAVLIDFHLGSRATLIGSDMGDRLSFWAEGGLLDLPDSGAKLRYSTGWHDWQTGVANATTPPEIARHLIAANVVSVHTVPEANQMDAARAFVLQL